jgi:hypothetical protein
MGDLSDVEKELDGEREKLNKMVNEAGKSHQPIDEAILEQSRKVDGLLAKVQRARLSQEGKTHRPRDDWGDR